MSLNRALSLAALAALTACATGPSSGPMTFFVTSVGSGKGADLGGLAGADAHCQKLAGAAGAGSRTWRAYLSTPGQFPGAAIPPACRRCMRATASARAPGTTPRAS
ncbi:hypothetical protein [Aquincola sp. J276]|uniref:hypothetical protein n=1 Tax=Aquincola sp. J276 TaxID=2898432 RepID=UPI0028735C70|nr:hypothetical protein [Aquincola sp. J276]